MAEQDLLEECTTYLRSVFPDMPEDASLHAALRDGVLLSRIVHILDPEFAIKVDKRQISFVYGANIQNFVNYCKSIKIPESYLPAPLSLVNNDPQALKSVASVLWLIYKLSGLGEWPSKQGEHNFIDLDKFSDIKLSRVVFDPRRFQEAQLPAQQAVNGSAAAPQAFNRAQEAQSAQTVQTETTGAAAGVNTENSYFAGLYGGATMAQSGAGYLQGGVSEPYNGTAEAQDGTTSSLTSANMSQAGKPAAQDSALAAKDGAAETQGYSVAAQSATQQAAESTAARYGQASAAAQSSQPTTAEKVQQFKTEATDKSCYEKQNLDVIYFDEPNYQLYPTFRCDAVILGAPGCGKTTLGMRIHQGHCRFTPQEIPQFFELVYLHYADNWPANIHLVLRETEEDKYMRECNFVFLCFSFNDMRSFKALTKYFKLIEKYGDPDVILVGLKADDRIPQITQEMIYKLLDSQKKSKQNSLRYHSISALKGYGVKSLLDGLEFYMNREEEVAKK